jgi:hypothetical protein
LSNGLDFRDFLGGLSEGETGNGALGVDHVQKFINSDFGEVLDAKNDFEIGAKLLSLE